jgi:hypothetical protein
MPVNKLPKPAPATNPDRPAIPVAQGEPSSLPSPLSALEQETDRDRELALSDAEWKNLWDATEVIDMDRF